MNGIQGQGGLENKPWIIIYEEKVAVYLKILYADIQPIATLSILGKLFSNEW